MPQRGSKISNDRRVFGIEPRAPAGDVTLRLLERDQRLASDTRTPGQRLLGDPPASQSALRQRAPVEIDQLIALLRRRRQHRS
jgi:hypothetical protein